MIRLQMIGYEWLFLLAVPFISLFFEGFRRKLVARAQNRIGPPVWQPFYDIVKLWKKKPSTSRGYANIFFRISPILYAISTFALFLFIPFSLIAFEYDFILLIYITILCSGFYILSGFSSNSPFGIIGSIRETITMVVYEISLATIIFAFLFHAGTNTLANFSTSWAAIALPISAFCMLAISGIEIKITPSDTAEASTEIMDGYKTEFSGKGLAMLELVKYMKFTFFIFLSVFLLAGKTDLRIFSILSLFLVLVFSLAQATTCRLRVDQTFKLYVVIFTLALIDLTRVLIL